MSILPLKEDEYRDRAAECDRMAEAALNSQVQEQYRDAADQWRELARQAKQLGK